MPGHSPGTCALRLAARDVLLCGDALATIDVRTDRTDGPRVTPMFNDERQVLESLGRLERLWTSWYFPVTDTRGEGRCGRRFD